MRGNATEWCNIWDILDLKKQNKREIEISFRTFKSIYGFDTFLQILPPRNEVTFYIVKATIINLLFKFQSWVMKFWAEVFQKFETDFK